MKAEHTAAIFRAIAGEKQDATYLLKLTATERRELGRLASAYKLPMAEVLRNLLQQAIVDHYEDGEVLALLKHNRAL